MHEEPRDDSRYAVSWTEGLIVLAVAVLAVLMVAWIGSALLSGMNIGPPG